MHRFANPARFMRLSRRVLPWTAWTAGILLSVGLYLALFDSPPDYQQGETVRIRLTSEDVTHGFYVPDLDINAGPFSPGTFKLVECTADRTGTFKFYCNILCSPEHGSMVGTIIVE